MVFATDQVPDTPDDPDYPPDPRRQQSQDSFRDRDDHMRQTSKGTIGNGPLRKPSQDNYGDPRRGPGLNGQGRASPYGDPRRPSEDNVRDGSMNGSSTRRPSEDTLRSVQHMQRPSKDTSNSEGALYRGASQDSEGYSPAGAPSTATSGVVIPNKSTIAEEEIQVPYGRDDDESRDFDSASERGGAVDAKRFPPHQPNRSLSQGLNALGSSLLNGPISPGTDDGGGLDRERVVGRGQGDYYDTISAARASTVSTGSVLAGANGGRGTREEREAAEQMRSEYEFKIATMQNRISTLEIDLANAKDVSSDSSTLMHVS